MKKYKIGYTSGVFDLFHIGHLNILKEAKKRCDFLIVGVSTDTIVREYKNKTPVIPYIDRVAIVSAIKYVDKVVAQNTMDKILAWEELKFDVMFHGSDWQGSTLYNKYIEEFAKVGVDVVFLPHTNGISSTDISKLVTLL